MSTTTIRLPDDIKIRVAHMAASANTNAHSFILQAITDKLVVVEQQADFQDVAQQRYTKIVATGRAIAWADMKHYLQERVAGRPATNPKARKLGA